MTKNDFMEAVKEKVLEVLRVKDSSLDAVVRNVTKTNGVIYNGLCFNGASNIQPVIYLDEFYKRFEEGASIDEVAKSVADIYMTNHNNHNIDAGMITDFEIVKDKIVVSIYNTEANAEMLADMPHKEFEDLSVYYRVDVPLNETEGMGSVVIHNSLMKLWGVSLDELDKIAWQNMKRLYPPSLKSMGDIIHEMGMCDEEEIQDCLATPLMYVFTASNKLNGAVYIADNDELASIARKLNDDLIVLPSSRHEVILMPLQMVSSENDYAYVKEMVREVNRTELAPEDFLSDNVYLYRRAEKELRMIA